MRLPSLLSSKSRQSTSEDDLTSSCTSKPEDNTQRAVVSAPGLSDNTTQASPPPLHHRRKISCGGGESDDGAGTKSNSCPANDSGVEIQASERFKASPRLELPSFTSIDVPASWCDAELGNTTPISSESNGAPHDEKDALIEDLFNHIADLKRKLHSVEEDNYRLRRALAQQFDQGDTVWEFCRQEEQTDDIPGDDKCENVVSSSYVSLDVHPRPTFRGRSNTLEPTPSEKAELSSIFQRIRCHSSPLPPVHAPLFDESSGSNSGQWDSETQDDLPPGEVETDDFFQQSPFLDAMVDSEFPIETPCTPDVASIPQESRPKVPRARARTATCEIVHRCFTCAFVHEHCDYMSRSEFLGRSLYYGFYVPGHLDSFIESAAELEPAPQDDAVQDEYDTHPPEGSQGLQTVDSEDVTGTSGIEEALESFDACRPPDDEPEDMQQGIEEVEESDWSPVSQVQERGSPDVDDQFTVNETARRILLKDPCLATLFPIVEEEQLDEEEDREQFVSTEPVYKGPTAARKKRFYAFGNMTSSLEPIAEHDDFTSVEYQGSAQPSCYEHERELYTSPSRGSRRSSVGTIIDEDGDTLSSVNTGNCSVDDIAPARETSSQVNTIPFPIERTEMSWWRMMEEDLAAGHVVL